MSPDCVNGQIHNLTIRRVKGRIPDRPDWRWTQEHLKWLDWEEKRHQQTLWGHQLAYMLQLKNLAHFLTDIFSSAVKHYAQELNLDITPGGWPSLLRSMLRRWRFYKCEEEEEEEEHVMRCLMYLRSLWMSKPNRMYPFKGTVKMKQVIYTQFCRFPEEHPDKS